LIGNSRDVVPFAALTLVLAGVLVAPASFSSVRAIFGFLPLFAMLAILSCALKLFYHDFAASLSCV
jgi:hypothetical protein